MYYLMWMWIVEFHILSSWTIAGLKVMNLLLICGRWKKAHLGNTWLCKHIRQLTVMRGKWRFAVLLFFLISFLCSTLHSQLTKLGEPCSGIMVPAAEVLVPWKCLIIVFVSSAVFLEYQLLLSGPCRYRAMICVSEHTIFDTAHIVNSFRA